MARLSKHWGPIGTLLTDRRTVDLAIAGGVCLANLGASTEWTPAGRSDRFWLELFSDSKQKISTVLIRDFINQYTLHRQGQWNCKAVLDHLAGFGRGYRLAGNVDNLASKLADCLPIRKSLSDLAEQRSAASKFAFFTQPMAKHHILDSNVVVALRARRSGKTIGADYSSFLSVVSMEYGNEGAEFDLAFKHYVTQQPTSFPAAYLEFHRRYYFDKFLMAQGLFVKAEYDRRAAGPNPNLAPRRKDK